MNRKCKYIKIFEEFIFEAENNNNIDKDDIEVHKRSSAVVNKEFFNELKINILYWFKHGKLGEKYNIIDIEQERRGVVFWYEEKTDNVTVKPSYVWKVKYFEGEQQGNIDKLDRVLLSVDLYTWNKSEKLKQMEIDISVKKVNEDFLLKRMDRMMKKVIKDPKNKKDKQRILNRTYSHLTDEYY